MSWVQQCKSAKRCFSLESEHIGGALRTLALLLLFSGLLGHVRSTIVSLGIDGTPHFTTHSFRHGGAVDDFLRGADAKSISVTGRFECSKSLKRYLKNGRSQLMRIVFTSDGTLQMEISMRIFALAHDLMKYAPNVDGYDVRFLAYSVGDCDYGLIQ